MSKTVRDASGNRIGNGNLFLKLLYPLMSRVD